MIGIKGIAKKPIVDATAKPIDVQKGKVFYNNSGKQSGEFPIAINFSYELQVKITQRGTTQINGSYGRIYSDKQYEGYSHFNYAESEDFHTLCLLRCTTYTSPSYSTNQYVIKSLAVNISKDTPFIMDLQCSSGNSSKLLRFIVPNVTEDAWNSKYNPSSIMMYEICTQTPSYQLVNIYFKFNTTTGTITEIGFCNDTILYSEGFTFNLKIYGGK